MGESEPASPALGWVATGVECNGPAFPALGGVIAGVEGSEDSTALALPGLLTMVHGIQPCTMEEGRE